MRFIELPVVTDPRSQHSQKFTWRSRTGLIKVHLHWAQTPDRQQFYFDGPEIVKIDEAESFAG